MKKSPQNKTYLNPAKFGEIIHCRLIQYLPEEEKCIIAYLNKANPAISHKELENALEEIKEYLSLLAGLFPSKEVSEEEVDQLTQKFFNMLKISPTNEQKENLETLIIDLLPKRPISQEALEAQIKEATKEIIAKLIIVATPGTILSLQDNKFNLSLSNNENEINEFFLDNIKAGVYKDPSTVKRTESEDRFKGLYKDLVSVENKLFSLPYRDRAQLNKELRWFPYSFPPKSFPEIKSRRELEAWFKNNRQKIIQLEKEEKCLKNESQTPEVKAKLEKIDKRWAKLLNQPIEHKNLSTSAVLHSNITLQIIEDSIYRLKIICGKLKDNPGEPGKAYPAFWETIFELACIYENYIGKPPDRSKNGFLKFVDLVIQPIIPTKKSLANTVRKVIEFYDKNKKEAMRLYKKRKKLILSKDTTCVLEKQDVLHCRECGELIPEESEFTKLDLAKKSAKLGYCEVCIANPKIYLKAQEESPQQQVRRWRKSPQKILN